jgi:hypothetical protein
MSTYSPGAFGQSHGSQSPYPTTNSAKSALDGPFRFFASPKIEAVEQSAIRPNMSVVPVEPMPKYSAGYSVLEPTETREFYADGTPSSRAMDSPRLEITGSPVGCNNFIGCKPFFIGPNEQSTSGEVSPAPTLLAPVPRLLGRGLDGSTARESDVKKKDVIYIRDLKIAQEPTFREGKNTNDRLQSAQELALPVENVEQIRVQLEDAKAQLEKEKFGSKELEKRIAESTNVLLADKAGVTDVEEMRQRLTVAEAQNKELLAVQMRLEQAEADAKEERESAITTVKALQQRLLDVEAEHRCFVNDNLQLKRRLDEHQAEVLRSMDHWRESSEKTCPVEAPTNTIDPEMYEKRLMSHEEHLKSHSEQLVESEKALGSLQEMLMQAEVERDHQKQENEHLLQRLVALTEATQASQRKPSRAIEPIHQYKDFKTVRGYRFKVNGVPHKIEIAHSKGKWQMALDGEVKCALTHKVFGAIFTKDEKSMDCKVPAPAGQLLDCILSMEWTPKSRQWAYELIVSNVRIAPCWQRLSKTDEGHYLMEPCWEPPEVIAGASAH